MEMNINTGFQHELDFWKGFVKTDRFLTGWVGNHKTPELNQEVADFILSVPHDSVLDVGSGVVSILNGLVPNIVAADPLGDEYEKIFNYSKYGLPVPVAMGAEDMHLFEQYDIVHISNAIDHSTDPLKAYASLLQAVKPGGYLIIQGFENEGEYEKYQGLHQWNLGLDRQRIIVSDKHDIHGMIESDNVVMSKRVTFENNKSWFIWICQRA